MTGGGGFAADAIKVFGGIDSTLLFATLGLVFVLLIIIYRSPIFWAIPLFSVIFAEVATRGVAYLFAKNGLTLNGQSTGIMSVLVFGAGTDYALLLVARYREELRRHESKFEAMHIALTKAGPAIVASAGTVILALLCLTLAEVNGTKGLGPAGAIGVAMAMLAMLTLLPALLVTFGRRAFWPFIPHLGDEGTDETHGAWRSLGERVMKRPRTVWIATLVGLFVLCAGMTQFSTNLTQGNSFRGEVESVQGQEILSESFPAGSSAPMNVVVTDPAKVAAVREKLSANKEVIASLQPLAQQLKSGQNTVFDATLVQDPYSPKAFGDVQTLRDQLAADPQIGKGAVLLGGSSAIEYDLREANIRDNWLIMPLVLLVVFVILALLLRALVLPLMLVGTVIVSFFAALGTGALVFEWVFHFPGSDPSLLLLSFIFLVALGVDYNIFLMARTREETQQHGTRMGMLRGLAVTGSVITSAGIVLAGTFAVLGVLPVVYLTADRLRDRLRRPARHPDRQVDPGARPGVRHREEDLVALSAGQAATSRSTAAETSLRRSTNSSARRASRLSAIAGRPAGSDQFRERFTGGGRRPTPEADATGSVPAAPLRPWVREPAGSGRAPTGSPGPGTPPTPCA